ncbi:probable E3 ubiquitin-protein ligase HECTD2 [Caerostris darwini]|uniref:HECT-type E3 ubiquitin transferase n=1 Tax=Caerostris darwini TaxID=1538125 RepID=A0AAV4RH60_9ARAC|nr:probable E3 ubiquitin-protein ligase HECTD2 [Caerostris darwini]
MSCYSLERNRNSHSRALPFVVGRPSPGRRRSLFLRPGASRRGAQLQAMDEPRGITCPSCRISIVPSRARAMCPFCGSFYNRAANNDVSLRRRGSGEPVRLPQLVDNDTNLSRSQPEFFLRGSVRSPDEDDDGNRQIVQVTGFGPLITDTLGVIHTYITGLLLPPSSPESAPVYVSLPPISQSGEGQLVTLRGEGRREAYVAAPVGRSPLLTPSDKTPLLDDMESSLILYPTKETSLRQLREDIEESKMTGDYTRLQEFYETTFGSLLDICATFKINPDSEGAKADDPELRMEFLYEAYDNLADMPSYVTKAALKATIGAVLANNVRLKVKDETKALFALLHNPLFSNQSSYTVFAHLFRRIVALSSGDHQLLINWFAKTDPERLRQLVKRILQFVTIREFPPANGHKLPSISKSRWWIPSATRLLALMNTANSRHSPNLIPYTEFYNSALDHINLMAEYYRWQNPAKNHKFSYCQYPFILSIVAKKMILQRDSEQQMILNARRSLMSRAMHQQAPDIDVFFLNLNVRRSHLVCDSLNEIARKQSDLKKKLKVTFVGEPGLDMGGLTKEWFLLLIKQIFDPDYGMFVYHNKSRCYWFSTTQAGNLREYNLIGVLMGLAVYNSIILDLHFPTACYKKLLSPPVVPQNLQHANVGVWKFGVDDLAEVMPDVAVGLRELLSYEGNVEEDFCMNFQVSVEEFGGVKTHVLKTEGENMPVTNENRQEYVQLYTELILNKAIYQPFKAFYLGFHSVCASNALIMLRPEEVEMLVCGCPTLDMDELRKVTVYDGFHEEEPIIKQRILGNLKELQFRFAETVPEIHDGKRPCTCRGDGRDDLQDLRPQSQHRHVSTPRNRLPISHTCFNQLVLPRYKNRDILREKLTIAISNAEGFENQLEKMLELSEKLERCLRTAVVYLGIIALGMCGAIPGPTLLDLEKIVQVETSSLSQIFLGRSIGNLIGSFLGGILLDYCKATQMFLLTYTFVMGAATFFIPWCHVLWLLISVMTVSGMAMGDLDTGLNVWCLSFWNDESSPFFQALHFFFGIGASLAPLITGPFLSPENVDPAIDFTVSINATQFTLNKTITVPPIAYAYGIISIFSIMVAVMFACLFLVKVNERKGKKDLVYQDPTTCERFVIILTSFLLLSVYAGIEIGYGQMIAVYAVKSEHKFTQFYASVIASVYWGTFTLSRGLSIFLVIKFSPITILLCDFSIMLLSSIILATIGNMYSNFLWFGTSLLGLGLASFYASTITWVEQCQCYQ